MIVEAGSYSSSPGLMSSRQKQYTYESQLEIYAMGWSFRKEPGVPNRIAIGSFSESSANSVQILEVKDGENSKGNSANDDGLIKNDVSEDPMDDVDEESVDDFGDENVGSENVVKKFEFSQTYPATEIMWCPKPAPLQKGAELLATGSDFLRIWEIGEDKVAQKCTMMSKKKGDYCSPVTSIDWNKEDPEIIGSSSIDTTCSIWNVEEQKLKTQLIAHDKEVYDMEFQSKSRNNFASVGADGSLRLFDLRNLNHSTITYESPDLVPLLRLSWNPLDANYLATMMLDSNKVIIIDIRIPSYPVSELIGHTQAVNAFSWSPESSSHIATCGEDKQVYIWDISKSTECKPYLYHTADAEINSIQWCPTNPGIIASASKNNLRILKI